MTIYADPALLIPSNADDIAAFWDDMVDWSEDDRLRLGYLSYVKVSEWCSEELWAGESPLVPQHLMKPLIAIFGALLKVTPEAHSIRPLDRPTEPSRMPAWQYCAELVSDLLAEAQSPNIAVASAGVFWNAQPSSLETEGRSFEFVWTAKAPTSFDSQAAVNRHYAAKTILIVGGQSTPRLLDEIVALTGVPRASIKWLSSERHKDPVNLDGALNAFDPATQELVFVFGEVGHTSFVKAKERVRALSYAPMYVERSTLIPAALLKAVTG